jgi:cytochrome c oxidase subunit 4
MASSSEEVRKHLKTYYIVFGSLAVLTIVTVTVGLHLPIAVAVAVAMLIACLKGSLVASFFMHLVSERGIIFWILALCVFFFLMLLLVPSLTFFEPDYSDFVDGVSGSGR